MAESTRLRSSRLQQLDAEAQLQQTILASDSIGPGASTAGTTQVITGTNTGANEVITGTTAMTGHAVANRDVLVTRTHTLPSSTQMRLKAGSHTRKATSNHPSSVSSYTTPRTSTQSSDSTNTAVGSLQHHCGSLELSSQQSNNTFTTAIVESNLQSPASSNRTADAFKQIDTESTRNAPPSNSNTNRLLDLDSSYMSKPEIHATIPILEKSNTIQKETRNPTIASGCSTTSMESETRHSNGQMPTGVARLSTSSSGLSAGINSDSLTGEQVNHLLESNDTNEKSDSISNIKNKLRSHGPYVRIYSRLDQPVTLGAAKKLDHTSNTTFHGSKKASVTIPHSATHPQSNMRLPGLDVLCGDANDLSVLDVSSTKTSPSNGFLYPGIIRTANNINRVTVATAINLPYSTSPSQMILARPVISRQGPRYARSSTGSRSSCSNNNSRNSVPISHWQNSTLRENFKHLPSTIQESVNDLQSQYMPRELASMPLLPFLSMSNSLQLYLKMNVLQSSEGIIGWISGSFLTQISPFITAIKPHASHSIGSTASRLFGIHAIKTFVKSLSSSDLVTYDTPQPISPGYLLLTSSSIYIFRPLFSLFNLKIPLRDEQTSYTDPTNLLELVCKFSHVNIARVDVGPSRQHLCFHVVESTNNISTPSLLSKVPSTTSITPNSTPEPDTPTTGFYAANDKAVVKRASSKPKVVSWVFLSRSRIHTTQIVDCLTTSLDELRESLPIGNTVNQDIESSLRNLQSTVFLRKGSKSVGILHYDGVWSLPKSPLSIAPTEGQRRGSAIVCDPLHILSDDEHDKAAFADVTKVDFDFIRVYLLGCFLRYIRPIAELSERTVKIEHISIIGTSEYIYITTERLDVWPPLIIPPEFSPHASTNARINSVLPQLSQSFGGKGMVADIVSQFDHVLGVGRMRDIIRVERWRTWRIDNALGLPGEAPPVCFSNLGETLQNGFLGFMGVDATRVAPEVQQGCTSGWFWWVRIVFGEHLHPAGDPCVYNSPQPTAAPESIPCSTSTERVSYWWDLAFANRDAVDELFDAIKAACNFSIQDDNQSQTANYHSYINNGSNSHEVGPVFVLGDD
ncbi:hypothetical protein BDV3_005399 [Batrachochytrium dendrobatidis]